ncbi:Uncharacterised protein [uncultured archaeon]|nr:Uncharacterised protein [uncultured archaeon]
MKKIFILTAGGLAYNETYYATLAETFEEAKKNFRSIVSEYDKEYIDLDGCIDEHDETAFRII